MEFLYFLEKIRVPWLDKIMLLLTEFGDETIFLVVALILFWCIDKYRGYYILDESVSETVFPRSKTLGFG